MLQKLPSQSAALVQERRSRIPEWLFLALLTFVVVGLDPFKARDFNFQIVSSEGDLSRQVGYLGIFFILCLVWIQEKGASIPRLPTYLVVLLLWCIASTAWSLDPGITIRKAGLSAVIILTVFMAIILVGAEKSLRLLRLFLGCVLAVNLLSVVAIPGLAVHQSNGFDAADVVGNWRGLHFHKNVAGPIAAISALLFLDHAVRERRRSGLVLFGLAVVFTVGTQSKTAMALLAICTVSYFLYRRAERSPWRRLRFRGMILAAVLTAGILTLVFQSELVAVLNDPLAFTGRSQIWRVAWAFIEQNPLLGSGFGAFWQIGDNSPIRSLTSVRWLLLTAQTHNGYLDILLTTGAPGLVLLLVALVVIPLQKVLSFNNPQGALIFSWLVFGIFMNFTETRFFQTDREEWVLYLIALALLLYAKRTNPAAETSRLQ